jgi:aldose sugar dehydrogenase
MTCQHLHWQSRAPTTYELKWLRRNIMRLVLASALSLLLASSAFAAPKVETVVEGLENPWGLAFLTDGSMLVTERPGRLRLIGADGKVSEPIAGVPEVVAGKQGGLLDVALDPDFATNKTIYLSFSEPRSGDGNGTSVARAVLSDDRTNLTNVAVIFQQLPAIESTAHFGGRLVFAPDKSLFVTLGDRYSMRDSAQDTQTHLGKIVHITTDGKPGAGNPYASGGGLPEIWSIGHRNVQGAAIDPATGLLWTVEHGARGGDEINRPEAGKNYGWPVITYGRDYSGAKIGEGTEKAGMEQPLHYWDPSIAPSGLAFYQGDLFPDWKGDLLVGALAGQKLVRLDVQDGKIVGEEAMLEDLGERIRDVRVGPDGAVYLLTDDPQGRVLKLTP